MHFFEDLGPKKLHVSRLSLPPLPGGELTPLPFLRVRFMCDGWYIHKNLQVSLKLMPLKD